MEPSEKPLPPYPKPRHNSDAPALSASSPTSNTSPRIRRKPLPPSAFSPQSILSSPISTRSDQDIFTRSTAPQAAIELNEAFGSPSRGNIPRHEIPRLESPTLQRSGGAYNTGQTVEEVLIADFPLPPQREVVLQRKVKDDHQTSVIPEGGMAMKSERPPPLRMESLKAVKALDAKKPQSPGNVFTSFFTRRVTASPQNVSPGGESSTTDISDTQSPYSGSNEEPAYFPQRASNSPLQRQTSWQSSKSSISQSVLRRMNSGASGSIGPSSGDLATRCNMLETELKDISRELAGSIRRELDLEDLVERLQSDAPLPPMSIDRTSDYFSDSGTSSVRHQNSDYNSKEEINKIKREAEQQQAMLKTELSQKWQNEVSQRKNLESHVQILEGKLSRSRQTTNDTSDASARIRELEVLLDDAKRRLLEERQTKENFEDLLTALRVELEQHRNERDNLRDEMVPQLRSQIEGLESSFVDTQKQAYDFARLQQEIQSLRDENLAIASARKMEQEMMRSGMHFTIEEDANKSRPSSLIVPSSTTLNRSSTVSSRSPNPRSGVSRSGSVSRTNSMIVRQVPDTPENFADKLAAVEQQRDALQSTLKQLRSRYHLQTRTYEKKLQNLEVQVDKLNNVSDDSKRGGYQREVRTLRHEINLLRKRADDALDQKWQCEKGLAGLKMDLDRSKQETASLQKLLQARDSDDPELLSTALENAMQDLQNTQALGQESVTCLQHEQDIADQLEESAERAEELAIQVRKQLDANSSLRTRLKVAVENGERNQQASAGQIRDLQSKLKKLEDTITTSQLQSETAVMRHEEELRNLQASHNAQLQRAKAGLKSPALGYLQPTPLSPMFAMKSPKLDNTSTGPGMTLNQALNTEVLEDKVVELEKALGDAEREMEEVVGRMNVAQIGVFELQQERDEAHRRTRQLEAEIKAEREHFKALLASNAH